MGKTSIQRRFVLLDANIVAGYYLPESLESVQAKKRIKNIIDAVRNGGTLEVLLFIPNLCIPEVFAVFAKYGFAIWERSVKRNLPKGIKKTRYKEIRENFRSDLHRGSLLQPIELNRYHILAADLISPVDANFEYYRNRQNRKTKRYKKMMGAADHTIIGMGINLSKIHGRNNFAILTADRRLADILTRANSVNKNTAKRLGLVKTAQELGLEYGANIYPYVINLANATKNELRRFFGVWPLPMKPINKKLMSSLSPSDCQLLSELRRKLGIGRDSLPYTDNFELICREFERIKGQAVDRNAAWRAIGRVEKKGKKNTENIKHSEQQTFF